MDEIYLGKKQKFIVVASNLDSGEAVWFGQERKKESLLEFCRMPHDGRAYAGRRLYGWSTKSGIHNQYRAILRTRIEADNVPHQARSRHGKDGIDVEYQ